MADEINTKPGKIKTGNMITDRGNLSDKAPWPGDPMDEGRFQPSRMREYPGGGVAEFSPYRFDLIAPPSIKALARVMADNRERHGEPVHVRWHELNALKLPVEEHVNRAITHLYQYLSGSTGPHLEHAFARIMLAIAVRHGGRANDV